MVKPVQIVRTKRPQGRHDSIITLKFDGANPVVWGEG